MKLPCPWSLQGLQMFPGKEYTGYYPNHYTHKVICEGRLRSQQLISKEEFLIPDSAVTAAHPLLPSAQTWALQLRRIKRRGGGRKKKVGKDKKRKLPLSSTAFLVSV